MNANIIKAEITAKTVEGVKAQVEAALTERGYNVVASEKEVKDFFNQAGIEGHLYSETTSTFEVDGEQNGDWEATISVTIKAHYKDAGSEDYVYSIEVTED